MLTVTIPVHPLSRAIILSEHGGEPVTLDNHDILFEIINSRITPDDLRAKTGLTSFLEISVNARLAAHLAQYGVVAGVRLFKFHKHLLCRYAAAQVRAKGKGHGRPALQEFLNMYGVEEDEYGLDTAYKLFQRFNWEIQEKNSRFFERMRSKTGAVLFKKKEAALKPAPLDAELAIARFMTSVQKVMKRTHRRLEKQARAYIYIHEWGMNYRDAAATLSMPIGSVHYSCNTMKRRMERNPRLASLLKESLALPEPA